MKFFPLFPRRVRSTNYAGIPTPTHPPPSPAVCFEWAPNHDNFLGKPSPLAEGCPSVFFLSRVQGFSGLSPAFLGRTTPDFRFPDRAEYQMAFFITPVRLFFTCAFPGLWIFRVGEIVGWLGPSAEAQFESLPRPFSSCFFKMARFASLAPFLKMTTDVYFHSLWFLPFYAPPHRNSFQASPGDCVLAVPPLLFFLSLVRCSDRCSASELSGLLEPLRFESRWTNSCADDLLFL